MCPHLLQNIRDIHVAGRGPDGRHVYRGLCRCLRIVEIDADGAVSECAGGLRADTGSSPDSEAA
jgi:hypothetical protein